MTEKATCNYCGYERTEDESYTLNGKTLCEDCHMEEPHPVKVCNPLPVMTAKKMTSNNRDPKDKLNEQQKTLYNHIIVNGKVTLQQLCKKFNLTEVKIKNQLAILRHLELIKGKKEEYNVYIVPF